MSALPPKSGHVRCKSECPLRDNSRQDVAATGPKAANQDTSITAGSAVWGPAIAYVACFNTPLSTGILRRRLPVAAKIALAMAGTTADVPVSPIPPGASWFFTM
jgi:hypothetical protein